MSLKKDWIDLRDCIERIIREEVAAADKSRLHLDVKDPIGMMNADPALLKKMLENLILNALNYSEKDINITVEETERLLKISIKDQGKGIEDVYKHDIFQKFFRIPGSKSGGIGLGLAIVKEIVDLHGGKISMEPVRPEGVNFIVTLQKEVV